MKHARFMIASTLGLLGAWTLMAGCVMESRPPEEPAPAPAAIAPAPAPTPTATTEPPPAEMPTAPAPAPVTNTASLADTGSGTAASDAGKYDPCAGKKCGDRCMICPPKTPGCFETALVKMCQMDGQCKPATSASCAK